MNDVMEHYYINHIKSNKNNLEDTKPNQHKINDKIIKA